MLGLISSKTVTGRKCGFSSDIVEALGVRCVRAEIVVGERARARRTERCLDRVCARLEEFRVRELVFSAGCPLRERLLERGFREAGCGTLLAAKAGEIVDRAAKDHERVLLSAPRADRRSESIVRELARRFRYLLLDAPEGAFEDLAEVCAEYGLTPERMGPGRFADVDGAVFLESPRAPVYASARCAALFPNGGQRMVLGGREIGEISFVLPEKYAFSLPFPAAPILSAAVECGRIDPAEIAVGATSVRANGDRGDNIVPA